MHDLKEGETADYKIHKENEFWLRIFRDHCQFIGDTLVPRETALIAQAQQFYNVFDRLLAAAMKGELSTQEALRAVCQFRGFKMNIANMLLLGQNIVNLPPGAFEEMLDEDDEYLRILRGLFPPTRAQFLLRQHLMWLPNNAAHAALAGSQLDPSEMMFFNKFEHFNLAYRALQLKAEELMKLLGENPRMAPPLVYLTKECVETTKGFIGFLEQYKELRASGRIMAVTPPLLVDHFVREGVYYLAKTE